MNEMFRTAFDGNGRPMRLTVTVVRADKNEFIIDVGTVPPLEPSDRDYVLLDHARDSAALTAGREDHGRASRGPT